MWMFAWFTMKKIDALVERCHKGLRCLLQFITVLYVLAMGVILPYYYNWETDYSYIGTNKADFFRKYGFAVGKVFLTLLLFYGLFSLWLWWKENREHKGKLLLIANNGMDALSVTDRFVILYTVALCLSYYYSDYRQKALLGISGWYMGFLPQLVLIGSYFAISRFLLRHLGKWLPLALSIVSTPVFLLGLLNRYGYLPPGMTSSGPSYISTIGNINWFCGYLVVLFPMTAALFVFSKREPSEAQWRYRSRRILLGINCAIGFATGITQGSDSGILALTAMMIFLFGLATVGNAEEGKETFGRFLELLLLFGVTLCALALVQLGLPEQNNYQTSLYTMLTKGALPWVWGVAALLLYLFYTIRRKRMADCRAIRKIWFGLAICLFVTIMSFVAAIMINTRHPGSLGALSENPLFVFDENWGSSRGGTWMAGIGTWQAQDALHKAVGVGPDGMWYYIDSGKAPDLLQAVQEQFGESRLTNAHGEWITILANLGIFGLIGYAGVVVSAIWRFVKGSKMIGAEAGAPQGAESAAGTIAAAIGCGLSLFTYTVNNIFSFQQTMQMTQVFLIMGLGEYMLRQQGERRES